MSLNDLKNHIKTGEFAPLYLFVGEENYLMRHYLSLVKGKILCGFEEMDLTVFEGKRLTAAADSQPVGKSGYWQISA